MQSINSRVFSLIVLILFAAKAFAQPTVLTPVAGNGAAGYNGDGIQAGAAQLNSPYGVAVDAAGNLYIADWANHRIRKVSADTGIITTVAGAGGAYFSGDGGPATSALLSNPEDVAVDTAGNIYIADSFNHRIRKVTAATGIIQTVAGSGAPGYNGEGSALSANLNDPAGVVVDSSGNIYIADQASHRVRKVTPGGTISTLAGIGIAGFSGDGGPAAAAQLNNPVHLALDRAGNLYIADIYNQRIRRVTPGGIITTVAGSGTPGFSGDGGPARSAQLNNPIGIAVDAAGNLYIADSYNKRIRQVSASTGVISTIAGDSTAGCGATNSSLNFPIAVASNPSGTHLFITDYADNRIWTLAPGVVSPPTLSSIAPASGMQGTTQTVIFTGTGFLNSSSCSTGATTVSVTGAGVVPTDVKVTSDTSLTAILTIAPDATPGARTVAVATESGESNTRQFTVIVPAPLTPTITSISPAIGLRGSSMTVTVTGTNFEPGVGTTNVVVSGNGIAISNISAATATSLTATFTIAAGAALGSYQVQTAARGVSSNAMPFAVNPQGPSIRYGIPNTLNPTEQVPMSLTLDTPSPEQVTGKVTLVFTSDAVNNADDPAVTFINTDASARTIAFTFPPNSTTAQFSLPGVLLKAGTVAGTIRLTMSEVKVGGTDVTPVNTTFDVTIPRLAPVITSMRVTNRTAAGFDVEVTGYSTSRDITGATFQFAAASGASLGTVQLQPEVAATFTEYYQSPKSFSAGSAFAYVQPFIVQQGDVNAVGLITLTLANTQGISEPKSAE